MPAEPYDVRRLPRRRRTISIVREQGRLVVLVPATLTMLQERKLVPPLVSRYLAAEQSRRAPRGDAQLAQRAQELFDAHLAEAVPGFRPEPSVTWSTRQQARWGSATPAENTIRLSSRLRVMPSWVVDYVIIHELVHFIEIGHTARFHALVARYPHHERARGYLEGFAEAQGWGSLDD